MGMRNRDLARNEEFSKKAVINFFIVLKKTTIIFVGRFCFSNRVINNWNSLLESVISSPSVSSSKSRLDQHWYNHI